MRTQSASALSQTLEDIEVIVVNDGSTDRTPEIAATFSDPRLRVISQANGGLPHARNTGIRQARAAFIGFLDGDDCWHPEKALRQLAAMEGEEGVGITFCHSRYIDEDGCPNGRILLGGPMRPTLRQLISRNLIGNGSTPIVRKDCFDRAGLFNERLASWEDWEMWIRIIRDTPYTALLVPEPLTDYRLNTSSISFDFERYMRNAEIAADILEAGPPPMARRDVMTMLAMSYRIAGSKALKVGQKRLALRMIGRAVRIDPAIAYKDPRTFATLAMMIAPSGLVEMAHRTIQWRAGLRPLWRAAK